MTTLEILKNLASLKQGNSFSLLEEQVCRLATVSRKIKQTKSCIQHLIFQKGYVVDHVTIQSTISSSINPSIKRPTNYPTSHQSINQSINQLIKSTRYSCLPSTIITLYIFSPRIYTNGTTYSSGCVGKLGSRKVRNCSKRNKFLPVKVIITFKSQFAMTVR